MDSHTANSLRCMFESAFSSFIAFIANSFIFYWTEWNGMGMKRNGMTMTRHSNQFNGNNYRVEWEWENATWQSNYKMNEQQTAWKRAKNKNTLINSNITIKYSSKSAGKHVIKLLIGLLCCALTLIATLIGKTMQTQNDHTAQRKTH